jgi:choline transport protein
MATSLSIALPSGGPTAVIWGIVVAGICNVCMAASLAEITHVYPTSESPNCDTAQADNW